MLHGVEFLVVPPSAPYQPPRRRRRSSQKSGRKRLSRMFIGATAGIVLALLVFGAVTWQRLDRISAKIELDRPSAQASLERGSTGSAQKVRATSRPVYRYSVIPGGVHTPNELITAMANDSAVAEHYATV